MDETPMHIAYEEAKKDAKELNIPVTGSEVVGLVPLQALLGKNEIESILLVLIVIRVQAHPRCPNSHK